MIFYTVQPRNIDLTHPFKGDSMQYGNVTLVIHHNGTASLYFEGICNLGNLTPVEMYEVILHRFIDAKKRLDKNHADTIHDVDFRITMNNAEALALIIPLLPQPVNI